MLWLAMGIPTGIVSAVRSHSLLDRTAMVDDAGAASRRRCSGSGSSLLYLFAQDVGLIPIFPGIGSYVPLTEDPLDWASARWCCPGSCSPPHPRRSTPATCARA